MRALVECHLTFLDDTTVEYWDSRNVTYDDSAKRHEKRVRGRVPSEGVLFDTVDWLAEQLQTNPEACDPRGLEVLGRLLFELAFPEAAAEAGAQLLPDTGSPPGQPPGTVRRAFVDSLVWFEEQQAASQQPLLLVLTFDAAAASLAALPWEFLYHARAAGGTFLAGHKRTLVITRHVSEIKRPKLQRSTRPKILFVHETPKELPQGELRKLVGFMRKQSEFEVHELDNPSLADLRAALDPDHDPTRDADEGQLPPDRLLRPDKGWFPDIVHVVAHGLPGELMFSWSASELEQLRSDYDTRSSLGQPASEPPPYDTVDAGRFASLFARTRKPALLFLQACFGARRQEDRLVSTAVEVVNQGVPAVVAMQYEIDAVPANEFALAFYSRLAVGETVGQAVFAGRQKLAPYGWLRRDPGAPVIYLEEDTALVDRPAEAVAHVRPEVPLEITTCPRCRYDRVRAKVCPECRFRVYCPRCGNDFRALDGFCDIDEEVTCEQPPWSQSGPAPAPVTTFPRRATS